MMTLISERKHLLIFGGGYSAGFLMPIAQNNNWYVTATRRNAEQQKQASSVNWIFFDTAQPNHCDAVPTDVTHILVAVPPDDSGDLVLPIVTAQLADLINLERVLYCSTTGVYGDHLGGWVDEETLPRPTQQRSKNRLLAESQWQDWGAKNNIPVDIIRISGIYGPGRSVIEDLKQGKARHIVKPGHYFNRVHVEDLARAYYFLLNSQLHGDIYNIADDHPCPSSDLIIHAAKLLKCPIPKPISLDEANLSPMAQGFYLDNKRVKAKKIKEKLNYSLLYTNYRQGLTQIAKAKNFLRC